MAMSNLVPKLRKNDIISSGSTRYLVLSTAGQGAFGSVSKCINLKTAESTALKIQKHSHYSNREVRMLQKLEALNHEKANLVRCTDKFMRQGMSCLAFEMLDQSLWDLVKRRRRPLSLNEIRPIAHQLLVTLRELKSVDIIHSDLKPDNVMLVNHEDQPFKVKVIDFGLALSAFETTVGMEIQALGYRAPEVMLGAPISAAIDMWALGCILAFLYLNTHLFPLSSPYYNMRAIYQLLGKPRGNTLTAGLDTEKFFTMEWYTANPGWRMKTPEEHRDITGNNPICPEWIFANAGKLSQVIALYSKETRAVEIEDRLTFVDLLEQLLDPNPDTRLTPEQALKHRFLTMDHLAKDTSSFYAESALALMNVTLQDDSDDSRSEAIEAPLFQQEYQYTDCSCHEMDFRGFNIILPNPHKQDSAPQPMQSGHNNILYNNATEYDMFDSYQTGELGEAIRCIIIKTPEEPQNILNNNATEYDMFESYQTGELGEAIRCIINKTPEEPQNILNNNATEYDMFESYQTGELGEAIRCIIIKTPEEPQNILYNNATEYDMFDSYQRGELGEAIRCIINKTPEKPQNILYNNATEYDVIHIKQEHGD